MSGFVSKKISVWADVLLELCKTEEKMRLAKMGRSTKVTDKEIIERALALYYGYLKGLIPEEVAQRCFEEAEKVVPRW